MTIRMYWRKLMEELERYCFLDKGTLAEKMIQK